jgi:hypothetical protein
LNGQRIEITFSIRQMIDGIQYIGFSDAVFAHKTIYFAVKLEIGFGKVFVIE